MSAPPTIDLGGAGLAFGERWIWRGLELRVDPAEIVAVLGPNGSGKTSLVKVLLGLLPLTEGTCLVGGVPPHRGSPTIGYVPQQRRIEVGGLLRGRDFVGFGLDGHRFGPPRHRARRRALVDAAIVSVGAQSLADASVDTMSGGEQQRLRMAQALVGDPSVLLCDEPLLSLDLARQQQLTALVDERRRSHGTSVIFVTHEINPILPIVDRVLYLVGGRCLIGTPAEVMRSSVLTELYGAPIEVAEVGGRIVVIGAEDSTHHHDDHDHRHLPDHAGAHRTA